MVHCIRCPWTLECPYVHCDVPMPFNLCLFRRIRCLFLMSTFQVHPPFCMSTVRLISKEPVCPFLWVSPFFKVSTVWDSINNFRPSAHILFPLAVINISSNPFSLPCPPYRVHYSLLSEQKENDILCKSKGSIRKSEYRIQQYAENTGPGHDTDRIDFPFSQNQKRRQKDHHRNITDSASACGNRTLAEK